MMIDYYGILNVDRYSSREEIIKAFRVLAKKYHPDVNQSADASAKFRDIFEAYEVLKDDLQRKNYNKLWDEYFVKTRVKVKDYEFESKFKQERDNAKKYAEKYSKMPYEEFLNSAIFNISFALKKSPTIGAIIMLFIVGFSFIIPIFYFVNADNEGTGLLVGLFMLLVGGAFIYVGISDWNKLMEERKRNKPG